MAIRRSVGRRMTARKVKASVVGDT